MVICEVRPQEKKTPFRNFHTSETTLVWPAVSAVKEKPSITTFHEMREVPVTLRPVNPLSASRISLTSPRPDQDIVMLTTPSPISSPWVRALTISP